LEEKRGGCAEIMRLKLSAQREGKKNRKTHTYIDIHKKDEKEI
jgi:hypothetical protein